MTRLMPARPPHYHSMISGNVFPLKKFYRLFPDAALISVKAAKTTPIY